MNTEHKLDVLLEVANLLTQNEITYAIGGSLLLYFKGIVDSFNDIDILIVENDVEKVEKLLINVDKLPLPGPNPLFLTDYFLKYEIDGVKLDIMAGFKIVSDGKTYDCSFDKNQIIQFHKLKDTLIPLHSLKLWRTYYKLMNRQEKVTMIDAYFVSKKPLKNLIFDMGNVLIHFKPEYFISRAGITNDKDKKLLLENIFESDGWPKLDSGELNEEDLLNIVLPNLPQSLHKTAQDLILGWFNPIIPMEGMEALLKRCKKEGYHLYLLSNASRAQHQYWPYIPGYQYFDGTVISADILCVKPDPKIYTHLLSKFNLNADQCLFIDDVPANLLGASQVGIDTYFFQGNSKALEQFLFD